MNASELGKKYNRISLNVESTQHSRVHQNSWLDLKRLTLVEIDAKTGDIQILKKPARNTIETLSLAAFRSMKLGSIGKFDFDQKTVSQGDEILADSFEILTRHDSRGSSEFAPSLAEVIHQLPQELFLGTKHKITYLEAPRLISPDPQVSMLEGFHLAKTRLILSRNGKKLPVLSR
jgi:hypothetical protein